MLVEVCRLRFPDQGSDLSPVHWQLGALATGPPAKPQSVVLSTSLVFLCDRVEGDRAVLSSVYKRACHSLCKALASASHAMCCVIVYVTWAPFELCCLELWLPDRWLYRLLYDSASLPERVLKTSYSVARMPTLGLKSNPHSQMLLLIERPEF